jgi:hypothetical protein
VADARPPVTVGPMFDGCGTLVQGVECVLFQADSGGLYILGNHGTYTVGDYVHVRGRITNCVSYCMQGDGCILNNTIGPCLPDFDDCGFLIQGVECVLFQADGGGLYILSDRGGFQVGDYVHVTGFHDPFCISYCMQGNGCIFDNTIEACDERFHDCGYLVQGVECVLFQADGGGLYVLDDYGNFDVGDYVRVTGYEDPDCITICQQGDGCILDTVIRSCRDPRPYPYPFPIPIEFGIELAF